MDDKTKKLVETGDFAIRVTVRNNRILRAMYKANIESQTKLAELSMTNLSQINALINFRASPLLNGDWSNIAFSVSAALHVEPEDLWPEHMRHLKVHTNRVEFTMDLPERKSIVDKEAVKKLFHALKPRHQKVIHDRFWDNATLKEAGAGLRVGGDDPLPGERVRQLEAQAMLRLKARAYKMGLRIDDFLEIE